MFSAEEIVWAAFQSPHYQRHNQRRQEHLASLHLPLHNRSVLELGAGIGDHTTFFLDRGCRVIALEVRKENINVFLLRYKQFGEYAGIARLDLRQDDLNHPAAKIDSVEVVYNYGLLYHLEDPLAALKWSAELCTSLYLLELCVSPGDHEAVNLVKEDVTSATQAYASQGCRPTRPWVFNRLSELFPHVYMPRTQPAHEEFPLDWANVPGPRADGSERLSRAVFIASRQPIASPYLVPEIPRVQTR